MRIVGRYGLGAVAGLVALVTIASAGLEGQDASYLNYAGLTRELRELANSSTLATLRSIGKSHENRDIWLVEIGNPLGSPLQGRPGLLIVGNLTGDHVVGSALALATIRYLLEGGSGDTSLPGVLSERVVYVVPRLNPDGAEATFGVVKSDRRRNARPFDDDNDGRVDEDPPEDLNGDFVISVMRKLDSAGAYMVDSAEPRLMKKADPSRGEVGAYKLYTEGRDNDGDGFLNEDGPGGVDLDRNFQHAYPYWQRDAGPYMVSEPESRALMDFVAAHRNIAAILTYGLSDNLVTPPDARGNLADPTTLDLPAFALASNDDVFSKGVFQERGGGFRFGGFGFRGRGGAGPRLRGAQPGRDNDPNAGRRPATTVNAADLRYFDAVSKAYREITGITKVGINRKAEGAFFQYGYFQFGVPSFSTQGWGLPQPRAGSADSARAPARTQGRAPAGRGGRAGAAPSGADATILAALEGAGIDAFVDWKRFDHPDLGAVEIGGFRPLAVLNPPEADLSALGQEHGAFAVRLASMLPRVKVAATSVKDEGGGVFTVTAEVSNSGYFPTALQHGLVSRSVKPTMVQIEVPPEAVLTGDAKTSSVQRLDGSGGRQRFRWIIKGQRGSSVLIRVLAQKGGTDSATVTLR